ncbi:MFS transporter [Pullulanibacillus sp. KACC 23026]|uniref:MFS transporter n=1 Tax=Pullulanibacillus sp. KACC 23026 TaxID=3028315 RepID=UPI0023B1FBAE|nr:MFS transporter [Pullulanibacillus sp. KACC 23026]WEG11833.1 MFS transporter [Pullulanibacillus sp. KACC 23026]
MRLTLIRLSVMMFLEYFVHGAWYVTCGLAMAHYGFSSIIGLTYSLVAVASIIAPLILGVIADRFFSSERVLGVLHLIGGLLLLFIPAQLKEGHSLLFLLLLFLFLLCLMPTFALTNNVGFHHVSNSEKQFPIIRVFGTIGWIIAGLFIGQLGLSDNKAIFFISGGAALLLGLYSFTLPHTPAPGKGKPFSKRDLFRLDAFLLFRNWNFAVFMLTSLLFYIPISTYYSFAATFLGAAGFKNVSSIMSIGQMLEVIFMLSIPFFLLRVGIKNMLMIGMAAWIVRFVIFSFAGPAGLMGLIIVGIAIHGICSDFFMITGTIYAEKAAGPEVKAQTQSLFTLFTNGFGSFIGSLIAGGLYNSTISQNGADILRQWQTFWIVPALIGLGLLIAFFISFKQEKKAHRNSGKKQAAL